MARYIDADKAVELIKNYGKGAVSDGQVTLDPVDDIVLLAKGIDLLRTADVVEVKHGKWKECFEDWRKQIAGDECSACGFQHYGTSITHYNYCPNCGARMDGDT